MMTETEIRDFIQLWEREAAAAAAKRYRGSWEYFIARVWTLEFVLDLTDRDGYIHPQERIPFPTEVA
jgi:hypothetical protein